VVGSIALLILILFFNDVSSLQKDVLINKNDIVIYFKPSQLYYSIKSFLSKALTKEHIDKDIKLITGDISNFFSHSNSSNNNNSLERFDIQLNKPVIVALKMYTFFLEYVVRVEAGKTKELNKHFLLLHKKLISEKTSLFGKISEYFISQILRGGWKRVVTYYRNKLFFTHTDKYFYLSSNKNIKNQVLSNRDYPISKDIQKIIKQEKTSDFLCIIRPSLIQKLFNIKQSLQIYVEYFLIKASISKSELLINVEVVLKKDKQLILNLLKGMKPFSKSSLPHALSGESICQLDLKSPFIKELYNFHFYFPLLNRFRWNIVHYDAFQLLTNISDHVGVSIYKLDQSIKYFFHPKNLKSVKFIYYQKLNNKLLVQRKIDEYLRFLSDTASDTFNMFTKIKIGDTYFHRYLSHGDELDLTFGIFNDYFFYSTNFDKLKTFVQVLNDENNLSMLTTDVLKKNIENNKLFIYFYGRIDEILKDSVFSKTLNDMGIITNKRSSIKVYDGVKDDRYCLTLKLDLQ
jgi:hypothetical protein